MIEQGLHYHNKYKYTGNYKDELWKVGDVDDVVECKGEGYLIENVDRE
mgnify:CR=1 FL=1|tara:strand:+ start:2319 stop:2462 length:144 start_codon:yes stop_codon:yes gene_type:complete